MKVFANRNDLGINDRLGNELISVGHNQIINIAVAFFTNSDVILKLLEQGCIVRLIVRLNEGTKPDELRKIYGKENLEIKYFTRETFHPKLYIVESYALYLGSSNLTKPGLSTNTELNLKIDYEDNSDIFDELSSLFDDYWVNAQPLSSEDLKKFESIITNHKSIVTEKNTCSTDILNEIGDYGINNVTILSDSKASEEKKEKDKLKQFIGDTKRSYGNYVNAFRIVESLYNETAERKWTDIPLRIEVDRFLWWLGQTQYKKEEWNIKTLYNNEKRREIIRTLKKDFLLDTKNFDEKSTENYFILNDKFRTKDDIVDLGEDELFEVLYMIYAFGTHAQYEGGKAGLKEEFYTRNTIEKIKETLIYLLHSSDDYILRLYQCIKGKYKLNLFGEHSVKELYGYINSDNNPIYNGRIQHSMSWLGFGIL